MGKESVRASRKASGKGLQFQACPFERVKCCPRRSVLLSMTVTREGRFSFWITTTEVIDTEGLVFTGFPRRHVRQRIGKREARSTGRVAPEIEFRLLGRGGERYGERCGRKQHLSHNFLPFYLKT